MAAEDSKGHRWPLVAGLVVLTIGVGWFLTSAEQGPAAPTPEPPARATSTTLTPPRAARAPTAAALNDPRPGSATDTRAPSQPRQRLESPLETYRRFAIYPPSSRRLHPEKTDLIDWNRRHETARAHPEDPTVSALFTADRYHLVGEQTLSPVLTVQRDGRSATAEIIESHVRLPDGRTVPYELSPQGEVYVGLIQPSAYGLEAPARLEVEVTYDAGPGPVTARINAMFVPDAAAPARFTGAVRDAMVDGSLVVEVELDVSTGGLYLFDANLFGPEGETIAWTRHKPRLEPGVHQIPLRFFGKVLVDAGVDGPYTVGQLRAALAAPDRTPSTIWVPPFEGEITTATYRAAEFSDAEWDAPAKRDRIRRLQRLEALGGPRIGRPLPPDEADR